jgi:Putative bacterial sensory transduction regulator
MDQRDETRTETLLGVLDPPVTSIEELVERSHRALSAHLWATCCWSDDGADWKIGDFNFLVLSVEPDADASLYVQFWSEPCEHVLMEVGSGEWCPGAIRYIGPAQRNALDGRGYKVGGRARNYRKEVVIDSAAAAESAALEALHVLFDVFGYRGQWKLEVKRHRGERADHQPVYTSLSPDDFAKVAVDAGCDATITKADELAIVALKCGRRAFFAFMDWRVHKQTLYALVTLKTTLTLRRPVTEDAITEVNSTMRLVKVSREDRQRVRLQMPLLLDGGVTAHWLAKSLEHWIGTWGECERRLRRRAVSTKRLTKVPRAELIQ